MTPDSRRRDREPILTLHPSPNLMNNAARMHYWLESCATSRRMAGKTSGMARALWLAHWRRAYAVVRLVSST